MHLLYATRIRFVSLAHLRIADIVMGAIWRAVRVLGPEVRRWRVGKVVINCSKRRIQSVKAHEHTMRKVKSNERSSTSTFWIFATWSLKIPSDSLERNATTCSSCATWRPRQVICHIRQTGATYGHLPVVDRVDVLKRVDGCRLSPHGHQEVDCAM
jgi:hypothetical protein